LAGEALADMAAMNAVAPQQSVRMAAHQPEVQRPIQRATPALCSSTQGLDTTEVATAASVQQLDANGVSAQAIHPHRATQPISTSACTNAAAPTCGKQATALKQKFEKDPLPPFALPLRDTATADLPSSEPCYVRSKRARSALQALRSGPLWLVSAREIESVVVTRVYRLSQLFKRGRNRRNEER